MEVDGLLACVRCVYNIIVAGWVPSGDSIIHYIDHFDLIAYSQCGRNHELCRILRIGCELAVSAQICSSPAFNAVDLTDEIETVLQSRCDRLRSRIFGPLASYARVAPYFCSRSDGVEVFVIGRDSQVSSLCTPVCDVARSVNTREDDALVCVNVQINLPEVSLAFNSGHASSRPCCIGGLAFPSVSTYSSTVCFPPVLSHLAIDSLYIRLNRSSSCKSDAVEYCLRPLGCIGQFDFVVACLRNGDSA